MKRIANGIFVALGFLCVALGAVGIVVPILPTVPFLLGAAICFTRGSERFHRWFSGTGLYRRHLQSFMERRAMTRRQKAWALGMMTAMMVLLAVLVPRLEVRLLAAAVIALNYWLFAAKIRTISREEAERFRKEAEAAAGEEKETDGE